MRIRRTPQSASVSEITVLPAAIDAEPDNSQEEEAVIPDVGSVEYFIHAPEVINMANLTIRLGGIFAEFRGTTVETIKGKIEEANMPRAAKRAFISSGMPDAAAGAAKALGYLLAQPDQYPSGDVRARYQAAQIALNPYKGKIHNLNESEIYTDIYTAASNIEPHLKSYWNNSHALNNRLTAEISDNQPARYMLAKIVSATASSPETVPGTDSEHRNATTLLRLLNSPEIDSKSLPAIICQEISDGLFDNLIASEILAQNNEPPISRLLDLIERTTGAPHSSEVLARLSIATDIWPKEALSVLIDRRNQLVQTMRTANQHSKVELDQTLGIKDEQTTAQQRFDAAMDKLISSVNNVKRGSVGNAGPQVMRKRFAETGRPVVRSVINAPKTPEVIKNHPNTMTFVDKDGNISYEDSEKYRNMISRVVEAYKGTPGIQEDINNILQHLSNLDFNSPGQRRGLEKISEGDWSVVVDGQLQRRSLFRFKASETPGLSIRNPVIKRHRVLLTMIDNDTVGLIGIIHKDKFAQFLKGVGIGTTVRGS